MSAYYKFLDWLCGTGSLIEEKMTYNNILLYREIFDEYKIYQGKISSIYNEFDRSGTNKKTHLLMNIRTHYQKSRAKFAQTMTIESIRESSDLIIADIEKELLKEIGISNNISTPLEAIKVGILVVMFDAFTRCKILENPNDTVTRH